MVVGYYIISFMISMLAFFSLYHYLTKKYNCFLYLFVFLLGYLVVLLALREKFVQYSGIALLFFGAITIVLGGNDWRHFKSQGINGYKLFLSTRSDRIVFVVTMASIIVPVFGSRFF